MRFTAAALLRLILPFAMIVAALFGRRYLDQLGTDARVLLDNMPYMLCVVAAFMAHWFGRCRFMLAVLATGLVYWLIHNYLQVSLSEADTGRVYLAVSFGVPVMGMYLLFIPERGIWNLYGLSSTLGFLVLGVCVWFLAAWLPQMGDAMASYFAPWPWDGYVFSQGATALVVLATIVALVLIVVSDDETEPALLGCLLALYLALAQLHLDYISVTMCATAALSLLYGLMRSSHAMAFRDDLTGLLGRRALNERLKSLGRVYTIAMLDIDFFKKVNDTYGHDVGDEVLKLVASRIKRIGDGGVAYRYGGEEFCLVFARRGKDDCLETLDQIRDEIANYQMSLRDKDLRPTRTKDGPRRRGATRLGANGIAVTVSIGVAERSDVNASAELVIQLADQMLYKAKKSGRNRVVG